MIDGDENSRFKKWMIGTIAGLAIGFIILWLL